MIKKCRWENTTYTPITVPKTEALMLSGVEFDASTGTFTFTKSNGTTVVEETVDLIFDDKSKQADVTVAEFKPLICKCCGAPINRETMKCEYCGVQYGK